MGERIKIAFEDFRGRDFQMIEEVRLIDQAVFDDLGIARTPFARRQGGEKPDIGQNE